MGKKFPKRLCDVGLLAEAHDNHFPANQTIDDAVWMSFAASKGWVALTLDDAIRHTSRERDHVMRAGIRLLVLTGNAADAAENFIRTRPTIERFLRKNAAPFIAKVRRHPHDDTRRGTVDLWLSFEEWKLRQP